MPVKEVCSSDVCLSVSGSEASLYDGVVVVGILGWRVCPLARGAGGIPTDPVEFPSSGCSFSDDACFSYTFGR